MSRRISLAIIIVTLISLFAAVSRVHAQDWVDEGYPEGLENASQHGEVNSEGYVSKVQGDSIRDMVRNISGPVPGVTVTSDVWQRNPEYARSMLKGSVLAGVGGGILAMYANPPADLSLWIRDTGENLGFIPKSAYAQGIGFSGLAPLLPLWKTFRNITYALLAFVMVIIGFMVMLRKKIDPKTVVTVQNALPNIVMTLILITFSYAIVGLMIDFMYVLIVLVVSIFKSSGLLPQYALNEIQTFVSGGIPQNVNIIPESELPWRIIFGIVPGNALIADLTLVAIGAIAAVLIPGGFGVGLFGLSLAMPLLSLIFSLAMLFLMIRLFVFFLGAYIKIIIALLFGPFQILVGAIPGSNGFSNWFRNLASNIIVFPVATVLFLLANVFIQFSNGTATIWNPPYARLWSQSVTSIGTLIAIGIMFSIPTIVGQVQELFKAKPMISAGPEALGSTLSQPAGMAMQLYQFYVSKRTMEAFQSLGGKKSGGHE